MTLSTDSPTSKIGVLLINLGSPSAPTPEAVQPYLAEFLSDPYVIDYPRWLWLPILKGIILRTRPARSAALYKKIWTEQGSPLITYTQSIAEKLTILLNERGESFFVKAGMRYGTPSIRSRIEELVSEEISEMVIFPLFPQYSTTTTQTALDVVENVMRELAPNLKTTIINNYHDHPAYVETLADTIRTYWAEHDKSEKLLLSFHGVPERYCKFDLYVEQCIHSARLIASQLGLGENEWMVAFQSRFGPESWVQPYTDSALTKWGKAGIRSVGVAAPGFAADCLETIDELGREAKETFLEAGGEKFEYIPALNDTSAHIEALRAILLDALNAAN
jgi:ferrochelatase